MFKRIIPLGKEDVTKKTEQTTRGMLLLCACVQGQEIDQSRHLVARLSPPHQQSWCQWMSSSSGKHRLCNARCRVTEVWESSGILDVSPPVRCLSRFCSKWSVRKWAWTPYHMPRKLPQLYLVPGKNSSSPILPLAFLYSWPMWHLWFSVPYGEQSASQVTFILFCLSLESSWE